MYKKKEEGNKGRKKTKLSFLWYAVSRRNTKLKMHIIFQSWIFKNPIELLVFGNNRNDENAARCYVVNNNWGMKLKWIC